MPFFAEAVKLSHILNCILRQMYDPWKEHKSTKQATVGEEKNDAQRVSITVEFDHDLDCFEAELPEVLHWSKNASNLNGQCVLSQQRHVLRSR